MHVDPPVRIDARGLGQLGGRRGRRGRLLGASGKGECNSEDKEDEAEQGKSWDSQGPVPNAKLVGY